MKENQSQANDLNKLALKLLEKRKSLGLTQDAMAKALDLSTTVYGGIERGTYRLNLKLLTRIANFLDISLKETMYLYMH